jgi:hypothetical protein
MKRILSQRNVNNIRNNKIFCIFGAVLDLLSDAIKLDGALNKPDCHCAKFWDLVGNFINLFKLR